MSNHLSTLSSRAHKYRRALMRLLLPHFCPLCRAESRNYLCKSCLQSFRTIQHPCAKCSEPLTLGAGRALCANCLQRPPHFLRIICPFEYELPFSDVLIRFKDRGDYRAIEQSCRALVNLILSHETERGLPEVLVPVPIHWTKRWRRGFNQSEVIAKQLSRELHIPLASAFKKVKTTSMQKELNRRKRLSNLSGSFARTSFSLRGKHIALIDDIVTTGTTVNILTELSLQAGAQSVEVWALARTAKTR